MQVTAKKDKTFNPVTLNIIIESAEEFEVLKALTARDFVVPNYLEEKNYINPIQESTLRSILINIHNELQVLG